MSTASSHTCGLQRIGWFLLYTYTGCFTTLGHNFRRMTTDIKLKDYILYKYKERKKKGLIILYVIDNIKWQWGMLQFHSVYTRAAPAGKM
jgi:hypothetical protein